MKKLVVILVLFFSSELFAKGMTIDCGDSLSYMFAGKNMDVFIKSEATDYQWKKSEYEVITENKNELIMKGEWGIEPNVYIYDRIRITTNDSTRIAKLKYYKKNNKKIETTIKNCNFNKYY